MDASIEKLSLAHLTPQGEADLLALIKQLTSRNYPLSGTLMRVIVNQPHVHCFVGIVDSHIVGLIVGVIAQLFDKKAMYIEDMIVAENARGKGIGRNLVNSMINYAQEENVSEIVLTSNPSRTAAIKLYELAGFAKYDTNFYRLKL